MSHEGCVWLGIVGGLCVGVLVGNFIGYCLEFCCCDISGIWVGIKQKRKAKADAERAGVERG